MRVDEIAIRLEIIRETAIGKRVEIMPDHNHLVCERHPQYGAHSFVRLIEGQSTRLLRYELKSVQTRLPTLWTTSYFITTVDGAPLEIIKQFLENKKRV